MSGRRARQCSPHLVQIATEVTVSGTGMGTHRSWVPSGDPIPCAIHPLSARDDIIFSQPVIRSLFKVYFSPIPALDGRLQRLKVIKPTSMAGFFLRINGMPVDHYAEGWLGFAICEYKSEDQQTAPTLLGGRSRRRKAK